MSDRSSTSAASGVFGARPNGSFAQDIVDAEYVVVDAVDVSDRRQAVEAETIQPTPPPQVDMPSLGGMDMLRRRALRAGAPSPKNGGPLFWVFGGALVAAAFWVSGGHAVIRPLLMVNEPDQGLRIASVISKVDRSGLRPVLQIDGQAVNDGDAATSMPPLNIEVLSPAGGSMHYKLGTAGSQVEGGASFAFSSRLDLPKDGVKTVFVTFAE